MFPFGNPVIVEAARPGHDASQQVDPAAAHAYTAPASDCDYTIAPQPSSSSFCKRIPSSPIAVAVTGRLEQSIATMQLFNAPTAMLGLIALASLPAALAKPYPVHFDDLLDYHNSSQSVGKRACAGVPCGYDGWLCCPSGSTCYTDANNQAQCGNGNANEQGAGGYWEYRTTTYVETVGLLTKTEVFSTYVPATATQTCKDSQNPCGSVCCDSGYYCLTSGQCALIGGGSSGGISPSAPLRPTGSGVVIVTYTGTPTATQPFQTPIPTGAAGNDLVPTEGQNNGLSGGKLAMSSK